MIVVVFLEYLLYAYAHIHAVLTDISNKSDFKLRISQSMKQETPKTTKKRPTLCAG